ncbi:hypothetical protein LPY66_11310 [Dehalobacter sp. DCM]|uniref:hypothetical protein n=1 Tax=Dehalobacter sp. DCM TaxID=2907827 RepID=UPI0030813FEF|nr:hypothetical protein LPY66_11310 [Dehalobacter sp. DCM]
MLSYSDFLGQFGAGLTGAVNTSAQIVADTTRGGGGRSGAVVPATEIGRSGVPVSDGGFLSSLGGGDAIFLIGAAFLLLVVLLKK